jgi:hypothetical protein
VGLSGWRSGAEWGRELLKGTKIGQLEHGRFSAGTWQIFGQTWSGKVLFEPDMILRTDLEVEVVVVGS